MENYKFSKPLSLPRGTHYGNSYLIIPSRKIGRNVTAFSNLEYENILTLEMNPHVEYFCEQPLKVHVYIGGEIKDTIFDCWVKYVDGREEYQEVKYYSELNADNDKGKRCREQVGAQKAWCIQNGETYNLRTDKNIELGDYYIRNLSFLAAKARRFSTPNKEAERYIRNYLDGLGRTTVGFLDTSGRFEKYRTMDYLAYLAYIGAIKFENIENEIISFKTEVIYIGSEGI